VAEAGKGGRKRKRDDKHCTEKQEAINWNRWMNAEKHRIIEERKDGERKRKATTK